MSFDSVVNVGDYVSAHYLAEVLPKDLRRGLFARWAQREKAGEQTPRTLLRRLARIYFAARPEASAERAGAAAQLADLHREILRALGFEPAPGTVTIQRNGKDYPVPVAHTEPGVVAVGCGWATDVDSAMAADGAGRLIESVQLDGREPVTTGAELARHLLAADEPPRYVLLLCGGAIVLADRHTWGEGRYLAANLDLALGRDGDGRSGELNTIAALFGADSLRPALDEEDTLSGLVRNAQKHAVGVSEELREGLQRSVELISQEVLDRLAEAGVRPDRLGERTELARRLVRESLRYLYRILFLLYAEARPELKVLPADYPEYAEGYGLARLGELVLTPLLDEESRTGFHFYESLRLLFRLVNEGHRPRAAVAAADKDVSEGEGIRFEPLHSTLFDPESITLIGRVPHPDSDDSTETIDTRLRNETLHRVLRLLMLVRGRRNERGGFISYAQLGINQLGAVYEGLMSYTGFIATEDLNEVARKGDGSAGSWMVPASVADRYPDDVFVKRADEETGVEQRVYYPAGSFVYRLAGRDRQTSASYYTPSSLTEVTVKLALKERLDTVERASELLRWRICEPALGSGAFLNEAINQVAAEYLRLRRAERLREDPDSDIPLDEYDTELRRVKSYLALHCAYGVDLNHTAIELAEVSVWLNVMHEGLQAPWFGLHLRRGNSLIGAGRRYYGRDEVLDGQWTKLKEALPPTDHPLYAGSLPTGAVHQFLLPAHGWAAVAREKEGRDLAPDAARALDRWHKALLSKPTTNKGRGKPKQLQRLQALAGRAEFMWDLVIQRLRLSEGEISRHIPVWGADPDKLAHSVDGHEATPKQRQEIERALRAHGSPYWRLRKLMDTWCALWFWPLRDAGLLDGTDEVYERLRAMAERTRPMPAYRPEPTRPVVVAEKAASPSLPRSGMQESLFAAEASEGPTGEAAAAPSEARKSRRQETDTVRRVAPPRRHEREAIPLANLDDWLDYCEALLGSTDIEEGQLFAEFTRLSELDAVEDNLPRMMVMDTPTELANRFPWLTTIEEIVEQQGFFHWELEFAHVFAEGGFDLQLGNPPWVRPTWQESEVLAELDPWFELTDNAPVSERRRRKEQLLTAEERYQFVADELANLSAVAEFTASQVNYELIAGTQPDLYRCFMVRTWVNAGNRGNVGLLHPDTHFSGDKEARLRAAAYHRLRVHADFMNAGNRFFPSPVSRTLLFGMHVYGPPQEVRFRHLSWMFSAATLTESLEWGDKTPPVRLPSVKAEGTWDVDPHPERVVTVDPTVLAEWRTLSGDADTPIDQVKLLHPVSRVEQDAITTLGRFELRLGHLEPRVSSGFHEKGAKDAGRIEWHTGQPESWDEVILQGPHLGVGTAFFKQAPHMKSSDRPQDLTLLAEDALPGTNYRRACGLGEYLQAQDRWVDHRLLDELRQSPEEVRNAREAIALTGEVTDEKIEAFLRGRAKRRYTEFYRVAWRRQTPSNTDRSLFAAVVPPGAAHVDLVHTLAMATNALTALVGGFWASLPIDYMLRSSGTKDLRVTSSRFLPAPELDRPLASALLLRTLRLNCLTNAYAPLWTELYDPAWAQETWAQEWPDLAPLGKVGPEWTLDTPLRTEYERWSALAEIDALVAVWLGMTAEQLETIYNSRFPVLYDYEAATWFDSAGRKIAGNHNSYGHGQTKEHYQQLQAHLNDGALPPAGYTPDFHKADRAERMREAHAIFSARLARGGDV